ncbi:MAG: bile acid:sodium symporter [Lentisphaeraceae bacterium]|nr:bile acid:sodium symporter [Lentisphaeraceae bacterium]
MDRIKSFILSNVIIVAVVGATALAFILPSAGKYLNSLSLTSPLIIIVFFCQGTGVIKLKLSSLKLYSKALIIGFIISQVLAPILAFAYVKTFNWEADSLIGLVLICTMAPTLVSGTIISEQASGDKTASLLLTIIINILAVFTVPFNLSWTLGQSVNLEVMPLLTKLISLVLIPALIGYFFRSKRESFVLKNKSYFKYIPVICLAAVIYISMSKHIEAIRTLTFKMLIDYTIASLVIHIILLYAAYYFAIGMKTGKSTAKSVAICCSQKTIPITIAIWTSFFSQYALALLPAIVFHMAQIYFDGIIAKKWSGDKNE